MILVAFLGMLAIYIEAAPLGVGTDAPPSPDLLLCVSRLLVDPPTGLDSAGAGFRPWA